MAAVPKPKPPPKRPRRPRRRKGYAIVIVDSTPEDTPEGLAALAAWLAEPPKG